MIAFIARRLLGTFVLLLIMSFVIYALIGLMPGDPIDIAINADPNMTPEDAKRLKAIYGLDQPIVSRYLAWLSSALQGDFLFSRLHNQPVFDVIMPHLWRTILLMTISFVLATAIAIPLGVWAAARPRTWADYTVNLFCFAGKSMPAFWLGLLLILLFAVQLRAFPASGFETVGDGSVGDVLWHLFLPVLALTLLNIAGITRFMRGEMIGVLRQDFIRTARAKGLSNRGVLYGHALRNAMIPIITILALEFGGLFSGALITEIVFGYPGMGKLIFDAILGSDFNLAQAVLLFTTLVTLLANLGADVTYAAVDPRISYS